jgi:hypothetical protein
MLRSSWQDSTSLLLLVLLLTRHSICQLQQ